jgi:hypothetical protein
MNLCRVVKKNHKKNLEIFKMKKVEFNLHALKFELKNSIENHCQINFFPFC